VKQKNILIITNKIVFPALDGGALAMKNLTELLTKLDYHLDIICISKHNNSDDKKNNEIKINDRINQYTFYKCMRFNLYNFLKSIYQRNAYQSMRFYDFEIKRYIQNKINQKIYNYIIFESIFTTIYIRNLSLNSETKLIYRAHNIEHKIWTDLAKNSFLRKIPYLFLANQIKRVENKIIKYVDHIFTLSEDDYKYFTNFNSKKTHYVPVTFEIQKNNSKKIKNSIVHLGAMDWKPNHEGMKWFMRNVLPKILNNKNNIYIGGKGMPSYYDKYASKYTHIIGEVKNAKDFIKDKEILFVPLFSGSGIRIKILEAMSLGISVISTAKGAKGIPVTHNHNIVIANTPEEFKEGIQSLINDKDLAKKIGTNGQKLIQEKFSQKSVIDKVKTILNGKD
tara:strand:+ start:50796 stop:51977 length:1182 start_codon:yes stop_codon:yes gene_type:complete